jgi:PAS domain S-box-containing protein
MFSGLKRHSSIGILLSLLVALLLIIGMGGLALLQLNRISSTVDNLTNQLAVERGLSKDIVGQVQVVRFHMNVYVSTKSQTDLDRFYKAYNELTRLLARAETSCSDEVRQAMLAEINLAVEAYGNTFDEVVKIIRKQQGIQAEILDIQEHIIEDRLFALRIHSTFLNEPQIFLAFGNAQDALEKMRLATAHYLVEGDKASAVRIGLGYEEAQTAFSNLEENIQGPLQAENLEEAKAAAATYYETVRILQEDQASLRSLLQTMREDLEPEINETSMAIATNIEEEFEKQNASSQEAAAQARFVLSVATLFAVLTGMGLGIVITRRTRELVRAQKTLRESEERYRSLFEGVPVGLYRTTPNNQFIDVNATLVQMLDYPDRETLLTVSMPEIYVTETDRERWQARMEDQEMVRNFEFQLRRYDGTVIWARTNIRAIRDADKILYYEGSVEDITEQKRAEAALVEAQKQLIHKQKLAVLGKLAGGVGHELRNPLSVISNALFYLQMILTDIDETGKEYLQIIADEVKNANKIISDLLDFGRIRASDRHPVQVADIVASVLEQKSPSDEIAVDIQLPEGLPSVYVDARQIEQVLLNLVTNAYEAMPGGGVLTISAVSADHDVVLTVTDTGAGISDENVEKLFEPLFTTKPHGIGLGLAMSKMLVEVNQGTIEVTSETGVGTSFTLTLPTTEASR